MIKSITMKECATYDIDGISIENCPKINFIYGPNGSGKSTISNYLQNTTEAMYSKCKLQWDNDITSELIVYNKRFKELNFKGDIAGIFTLGAATIDDIKHLDELKIEHKKRIAELRNKKESLQRKQEEIIDHNNNFKKTIWEVILKENEDDFKEAFSGFRSSKDKFMEAVIQKYNINHNSNEDRETLKNRARTLYANKPEKCSFINISIEDLANELYTIETDIIWNKVIIGNDDVPIASLINSLNNADWVNRGRAFIKEIDYCPFCQQKTINENFKNQLEQFFSGEYDANITYINSTINKYKLLSKQILNIFQEIISNNSFINIGKLDTSQYNIKKELLNTVFSKNISEMSYKEKEPSRHISLQDTNIIILELKSLITSANNSISEHNRMVDNYNFERDKLSNDIWTFLLDEQEPLIRGYLNDLIAFNKAIEGISSRVSSFEKEIATLNRQIIEAGSNITSVQPTVDEINRSLKAYGFTNFEIVPSDSDQNLYQIKRPDGTFVKNTLSEGEETFISFLYFLQLAKGATDISKISAHKILIIDDPICSLDSTILYIVSTMVKDLIKQVKKGQSDVEQIFILTHNVFFHKEASFIDGRTQEDKEVNYWIIHKDLNVSHVKSYGTKNPIKTSYELLWQELQDCTSGSIVTTQNIMRRIIENYFGMLGSQKYDYVTKKFDTVEDQMICQSLFYWINDGSHTIPDDLYIDSYSDSIEKYKEVFRKVFVITGHEAHYNMMMNISSIS